MIDFGALQTRINEKYSFVGIEQKNNQLIFHLPKGFPEEGINTFDEKRDLFFLFYRMLNVFKQTCLEKGDLEKTSDRDGLVKDESGGEIIANDDEKIIFYSKLDVITSILDAYDELKILTFVRRVGKSEKLDYGKLHRFLHKGIFLENGAVYLDSMDMMRREIRFDSSDIVSMYCYILMEIKEQLKEALEVRSEVQALAEQFRQKYLGTESSLFSEKSYQSVLSSLKDALEVIDNYTPLKDPDYWHFYDAIYSFLFGSLQSSGDGEVWGIKYFYMVWEAMCLTYLVKTTDPGRLLYVDEALLSRKIIQKFRNSDKMIDLSDAFIINGTKIVPDAVIASSKLPIFYKNLGSNLNLNTPIYLSVFSNDLSWNDNGYHTRFTMGDKQIKIAYQNQPSGGADTHTLSELKKYFTDDNFEQESGLGYIKTSILIKSKLNNNFYSYWDPADNVTSEEWQTMCNLNHIFALSLQKQIFLSQNFIDTIKKDEKNYQTITKSLFRKYITNRTVEEIAEIFMSFLKKLNLKKLNFFQIIDIKYHDVDYLLNPENAETIKQRSIRKQFVYEYLLQKHLSRSNITFKDWDIKSEFWLPFYSQDAPILSPGPEYLGGYVGLTQVNIKLMIDSYLEAEKD